jgi:hypothetical protein
MKRFQLILILAAFFYTSAEAQRGKLTPEFIEGRLYEESAPNTGPEPDYSNLYFWAASPYKTDPGDSIPTFLKDEVCDQRADAFFIHPISFCGDEKTTAWNADLNDVVVNNKTDYWSILFQSSVFNGSCRVFAPRYRQANMKAFYVFGTPVSNKAFDLAYADIRSAFLYFLNNYSTNRPIIIAAHSQGSLHAIRLLREFFDGKPLQKRLVCAYLVGYPIGKNAFKTIPVGENPGQVGCFVGWQCYAKGEIAKAIVPESGMACVNPLTWTTSEQWASPKLHLGILNGFKSIVPHTVGAGIEPTSKILWIETPVTLTERNEKLKNLHVYDYQLFWMNIRQNVRQRIDAYFNP